MNSSIVVMTPPAGECVTVEELGLHVRVQNEEEEDLLASLITASRQAWEKATNGHVVLATTFKEYFSRWADFYPCARYPNWNLHFWKPIRLSRAPVSAIASFKYFDGNDVEQTLSQYVTDVTGIPAMLRMSESFPVLSPNKLRPISVTYTAGYADAAAVPEDVKLAIKLLAAHFYWNREAFSDTDMKALPMGFLDIASQNQTGIGGF